MGFKNHVAGANFPIHRCLNVEYVKKKPVIFYRVGISEVTGHENISFVLEDSIGEIRKIYLSLLFAGSAKETPSAVPQEQQNVGKSGAG